MARRAAIGLLALVSGGLAFLFGQFVFIDSDEANFYFAACDMARGNVLLRGWSLPPDNFWPLDVTGMAVLIRFLGAGAWVPHAMAAILFAGVVAAALVLANPPGRIWSATRLLPVFLFMGLPSFFEQGAVNFLTYTPYHVGTLCMCLWGAVLVQMIDRGQHRVIALAGLCAITILLFVGDFFGIVIFVVPLALVSLLLAVQRGQPKDATPILGCIALGWIVSVIVKLGLGAVGAFARAGLSAGFIPIDKLPEQTLYTFAALADLYGIDVFGKNLLGHHFNNAIASGLKLISFVGVIAYFYRDLWIRRRDPDVLAGFDRTSRVLLLGALIDGAAAFLANFHLEREDIIRYFYPAFVYSVLLYARQAPKLNRIALQVSIAGIMLILALSYRDWRVMHRPFVDPFGIGHQVDSTPVVQALARNGLRFGFAGYWDASAITFAASRDIVARAIRNASDSSSTASACALVPYPWIGTRSVYGRGFSGQELFVVTRDLPAEPFNALTQGAVIAALGLPKTLIRIDAHTTVDVYDREILERCPALMVPG
ncbi:hypothetical protein [Tanticharoenia sakaeratensis]|uniref:Uncharacterized protein n=1 Tax=Tanticharoenia sakaeratensis NBRC 103193 TaxID=1231623 RepID=A0A0D6MGU7_9PROT|nr:hypothetical protein [Tanticharoenia sakaeratensis]GAN52700.1 hypothetical protein Tasa_001_015 [Tanticharoenia sakaeratensis NBRC 103193]GBQ24352.1 hypothetical protein AA103193_2725 [Tanticharoenia sakaeratensis NBRC 103193]